MPNENHFLTVIKSLYEHGEVILYDGIQNFTKIESEEVVSYLEQQYLKESLEFPCDRPSFDPEAAEYAAQITYNALQFILFRETESEELVDYFPNYDKPLSITSMLSADICLRYIPDAIKNLSNINPEDELILLLVQILTKWHYSGISVLKEYDPNDLGLLFKNECFRKLYIDRVIETKNAVIAKYPLCTSWVIGAMGEHKDIFWNELMIDNESTETS